MMRPADFPSYADYLRAHREAFCLAMELGCTPKEAEAEIKRRRAAECRSETLRRLQAKMNAAPSTAMTAADWDAPWMMRD